MTKPIITGMGAVTSVGLDAVTTCAAIRAGLSRPEPLLEHAVLDREEQAPIGVTGHPVSLVTRGFVGVARWLQLAALALQDLARSANLPGPEDARLWADTVCYVVVPVLDVPRFLDEPACESIDTVIAGFVHPLRARVAPFFSLARAITWCRGRVGVLHAIQLAAEHVRHRECERIVVLAVDSLTDGSALAWLAEQGRLKHDDNPVGLMPGEGAVALMLEAPWSAQARGVAPLGHVAAVATSQEPKALMSGHRSQGEALARVVEAALLTAGRLPYAAEVITDLNGETWRAQEYGHARVRVPRSTWEGDAVELPATSVGDLGAAMTALQLVLACRSLHRGYATTDRVLLTTSDEYGHVGAAVLEKAV
jgi:3-oxoacyl-[acyl-carrier-protein] synthase I